MALSTALTAGSSDSSNLTSCEIRNYANELQGKASTLKTTATSASANELTNAASNLRDNAQTLHEEASKLKSDDQLSQQATLLASAAGTKNGDGLAKDADELAKGTDHTKAKAVIEALKKVEAAYEKLSSENKYKQHKPKPGESPPSQEQRKVNAVETAWTNVNNQFVNLCKALIKQYATEVNNQATTLRGNASVTKAKAFKNKYDKFKDINSTIEIKPDTAAGSNKKDITVTNLPHIDNTFKPRQIKFWVIIIPSIICQWLNFLTYVILLIVYRGGGDQAYR